MTKHIPSVNGLLVLLCCVVAWQGARANTVSWDVVPAGGAIRSASASYTVSASVGQAAAGVLVGPTYRVYTGFWNVLLHGPVRAEDQPMLGIPRRFGLTGNHPNPFNSHTTIRYCVPRHSRVAIEVYDLAGRLVRTLADGEEEPGYHHALWDGRDDHGRQAASGVYLSRMVARSVDGRLFEQSRAMLVVR